MTFFDLDDAFRELERRADAELGDGEASDVIDASTSRLSHRRGPTRLLLAGASAAVVVVAAVGISVVASGPAPHNHARQAADTAGTPASSAASSGRPFSGQPSSSAPRTDAPRTQAELTARFRAILGNTATITVNSAKSSKHLITGVLTATSGARGFYVLELDKNAAICGEMGSVGHKPTPLPCPHVTTLPGGSKLKVDRAFPDGTAHGVMDDAILRRPDRWQISLYTANVQGKYYGAPVLGKKPALTTGQVTDVVTSPEWLVK